MNIRWMIRRDVAEVEEIERLSFPDPWDEDEFIRHLRERNVIKMVCEVGDALAGFMVCRLHPKSLELLNLAVHPRFRRSGVGTLLLRKLQTKVEGSQRRERVTARIVDSNLRAHLLFQSLGFLAVDIDREFYGRHDAYCFEWVAKARTICEH